MPDQDQTQETWELPRDGKVTLFHWGVYHVSRQIPGIYTEYFDITVSNTDRVDGCFGGENIYIGIAAQVALD